MSEIKKMNELGEKGIPFLFIFDYLGEKIFVLNDDEIEQKKILYQIEKKSNFIPQNENYTSDFYLKKYPKSFESYKKSFDIVQKGLHLGNSFLCNLTCETKIETNLSLEEIFSLSKAKYKLLFDNFVCFSPEIFVKIDKNGIISSNPMKGTIDASIPNAEKIILKDKKETAEHATIVDLIRNDLSKVAKNVKVEKYRYSDLIVTNEKSILQISSKIVGELPKNWKSKIGDIFQKLLPAGSISGAPKSSTLQLINEAENYERGFYTGIVGYFDGKTVNSGVLIRFIEEKKDEKYFKSGGGITVFSNPESEYQEIIQKIYVPFPRKH